MPKKAVPKGFHTLNPYVAVRNVKGLITFLKKAFGVEEVRITKGKAGLIENAELKWGDSILMAGELPEGAPSGPRVTMLYLYLPDCDAAYKKAVKAGAKSLMEPGDRFYGDRNCGVEDAWGNMYWLATRLEDLTEEEVQRRQAVQPR